MPLRSGLIGGMQVAGFRYVVYGVKRGFVSTNRTKRAALRSHAEDSRSRMRAGDPSDALIYFWRAALGGWELVGETAEVELVELDEGAVKPLVQVNVTVNQPPKSS